MEAGRGGSKRGWASRAGASRCGSKQGWEQHGSGSSRGGSEQGWEQMAGSKLMAEVEESRGGASQTWASLKMFFLRSMILRRPPGSQVPTSPVCSHPSLSSTSSVFSWSLKYPLKMIGPRTQICHTQTSFTNFVVRCKSCKEEGLRYKARWDSAHLAATQQDADVLIYCMQGPISPWILMLPLRRTCTHSTLQIH